MENTHNDEMEIDLMELFYAMMLPAVGSALLSNYNASSGGTDFVAMI